MNHGPFVLKSSDKAGFGALTDDSGTAGAVGQFAISNCGSDRSEYKKNSSLSCRGSTIENNERERVDIDGQTKL